MHTLKPYMKHMFLAVTLSALGACMQSQDLVAGDKTAVKTALDTPVYELEMGSNKEEAVAAAAVRWQAEPACETEKTGVGINRRAYFLETCTFPNPQQQTVCKVAPESVAYAFLEGELVQVLYRFAEADEDTYADCIQQEALADGYTVSTEVLATDTADTNRTRLINAESGQSITLGEEREVRVFDSKTAPTVHILRAGL